jgi:hypothetical protein
MMAANEATSRAVNSNIALASQRNAPRIAAKAA